MIQRESRLTGFQLLIKELALLLDIEFQQDIGSAVELNVEDKSVTLYLDFANIQDQIILAMSMGKITSGAEKLIYPALLEGNLLWSATGGATLGVNSENREAILSQSFSRQELTVQQLISSIERMGHVADSWIDFIISKNEDACKLNTNSSIENTFLRV